MPMYTVTQDATFTWYVNAIDADAAEREALERGWDAADWCDVHTRVDGDEEGED